MATIGWRENGTVREHMLAHFGKFNVHQLVRLLLTGQDTSLPIESRLRFRADLSAAFPGHEFVTLACKGNDPAHFDDDEIEIRTANYCIASVVGPLPEPFTEWVRDLVRAQDVAMADFFDMFNQRLNCLRFQFKETQVIALNRRHPQDTRSAHAMAALVGLSQDQLADQVPIPRRAWLSLAGLLANTRKSAATVTHVLSQILNTPVTLEPLVGAWQAIEAEDRMALGKSNMQLGQQSIVGRRYWDQQARIRLVIANLDYAAMVRLLPPGLFPQPEEVDSYYATLVAILQLLMDRMVDCEMVLQVNRASIPPALLHSMPDSAMAAPARAIFSPDSQAASTRRYPLRLGHSAWLHQRTPALPATTATARQPGERVVRFVIHAHDKARPQ